MAYDNSICKRGVYVVRDGNAIKYVGSSKLNLNGLEYNHRNWFKKGYKCTLFRDRLTEEGRAWTFDWLVEPFRCSAETIEYVEGSLIRQLTPDLNYDIDPVTSSKKYGRY
jgi:hypothetical protein